MLYWALLATMLLCFGATISAGSAKRAMPGDRPPIYYSESFILLINLSWVPGVALSAYLMYLDWQVTLGVTLVGLFLANYTIRPIAERLIILPLRLVLN